MLAATPVAGVGTQGDAAVALPRIPALGVSSALPRIQRRLEPLGGRRALVALVVGVFLVVAFATAGTSVLVPTSNLTYPSWEAGPLHVLHGPLSHLLGSPHGLNIGLSVVLVVMLVAYAALLASVRTLSMRAIVITVLALHAILLFSPPQQLTDVFNYLGYARLGGLHHLNPYTHPIASEMHDPVYRFSTWHHLLSPYGPLFTALTYPLAWLSLPVAYWTLKVITVLLSLTFIALVAQCARALGRDPRFAILFVAANPIFLMYAIPGFHNDFFMLVPSTAAIAFLLSHRDRSAGAAVMVAIAVKFTAGLLLPFLLLAARPNIRRRRIIEGCVIAGIPLLAMSLLLFGLSLPNLSDQATLLTNWSVPNLFGLAIGIGGGTPGLLRVLNVAVVLAVALLVRQRRDWLAGAGWATFALIVSLAWLVPWYLVWLLPLAALSTNVRLRQAALALTVFLVITFMPATDMLLFAHGLNPLNNPAGHASQRLQQKLEK
ncbi:MAG TPA: glycosyltransferase 87 family protein [Solirubrobacteraceae bacterium]